MTQVKIQNIDKNSKNIIQQVGKESFVNWDNFTQSSTAVTKSIDQLYSTLAVFRQIQQKTFIQTMKKLKSLDIPDVLQAVQTKKLPKQALRGILGKFKINGQSVQLIQSVEQIKNKAQAEYQQFVQKNKIFVEALNNYTEFINNKINQSGLVSNQKVTEEVSVKTEYKMNLNQQQASKLASQIKIQYLPGTKLINLETYIKILDKTYQFTKVKFEQFTSQQRTNIRKNRNNNNEYIRLIQQYLKNSQVLVQEGIYHIIQKLGISKGKFAQSQTALIDKGFGNEIFMQQSSLRGKLKQNLPVKLDVSAQVGLQVMKYQVEIIKNNRTQVQAVLNLLPSNQQSVQLIPLVLTMVLNDYVFEKFGYQQQQFMKNLTEQAITSNPQVVNIFRQMQMCIMDLMQNLKCIPAQVSNMMKQQQQMMQNMMNNGISPEMMMQQLQQMGQGFQNPNANPMDMLQSQQIQQMKQMFAQMGMLPPQ